ncbi:MAG TPA: GNAT family protein [Terracidiphilus sp.]|nr:GNAT family protein [Terracidiphilus sp.]
MPNDLAHWKPAATPTPNPLAGRCVTLEPLNASRHSSDLFAAVTRHDDLWTWLAAAPTATAAEMIDKLEKWRDAERALLFAIVPANTGKAAGWASYMRIKPAHGVIEVGNVMFSPALQRTRAATEAMYLMARHVFEDLGYRRYEWKCNALNEASRRAALRFGFAYEGIFRQHMVVKGKSRDTAWFAMLDADWPARKRAFEAWLDPANFDQAGRQRRTLLECAKG